MAYTVLIFVYRKHDISPAAFKDHLENTHVPLLESIGGDHFPKVYVRRYIQRSEHATFSAHAGTTNVTYPATVLRGTQTDFEYDAISEMRFEDEQAFQAFFALVSSEEAAKRIAEDEEMFIDRERLRGVVVGDIVVTASTTITTTTMKT